MGGARTLANQPASQHNATVQARREAHQAQRLRLAVTPVMEAAGEEFARAVPGVGFYIDRWPDADPDPTVALILHRAHDRRADLMTIAISAPGSAFVGGMPPLRPVPRWSFSAETPYGTDEWHLAFELSAADSERVDAAPTYAATLMKSWLDTETPNIVGKLRQLVG
jgi:hypothetical protein